jgi:hypothetical protein
MVLNRVDFDWSNKRIRTFLSANAVKPHVCAVEGKISPDIVWPTSQQPKQLSKSMTIYSKTIAASIMAALAINAHAITYTDTTGDVFTGAGGGILDITSVEVNNTATDLIYKINLAGNPTATDWGKYMVGIKTPTGPVDTLGNAWGRPITLTGGMNRWLGSWVDSGNAVQVHSYSGSWSQIGAVGSFAGGPAVPGLSITKDASSLTITTPLGLLGLAPGDTIIFDVYTSGGGGGDGAIDSLANPGITIGDWSQPYAGPGVAYTIPVVPEPTALALLGIGATFLVNRIRRR